MAEINNLQFEIQYASIVLIWYDWILTLPMEVKYIWGSKIRVSTIIYILCHYALLGNILYLFAISHMLKPSCDTWYKIVGALSILGRAAIMFSFTARAYAVWGRRRVIFAYLASIWIICIGLDIAHVPGLRCVGSSSIPIANDLLSILMVVFEFSSAILISIRCIQTIKDRSSCSKSIKGFWDLTFQQGILYFSFMSVFTTTSVILDFRAPVRVGRDVILYKIHIFVTSTQAGFYQRLLNALTLPLSGVLTSRFILHLRKCEHNLSALERVAVETVNTTAINGDLLTSIIEPQFGWDPVEVDALVRPDLEVADIESTAAV